MTDLTIEGPTNPAIEGALKFSITVAKRSANLACELKPSSTKSMLLQQRLSAPGSDFQMQVSIGTDLFEILPSIGREELRAAGFVAC